MGRGVVARRGFGDPLRQWRHRLQSLPGLSAEVEALLSGHVVVSRDDELQITCVRDGAEWAIVVRRPLASFPEAVNKAVLRLRPLAENDPVEDRDQRSTDDCPECWRTRHPGPPDAVTWELFNCCIRAVEPVTNA